VSPAVSYDRPVATNRDVTVEFEQQRSRLFALAYRLLGSAGEAEDAVQDAYLRWHAADHSAIATPAAWLTKVLTNLCLNRLASATARSARWRRPSSANPSRWRCW
jgi:RNA polymerase sigma-70 factor (ECF subfamily)